MPFDPALPQEHTVADAVQMRSQLNGLKELIDAVSGVTSAVVDSVTTVNPGEPANVSVSVSGATLHLSFSLPRGNDGAQGNHGNDGAPGPQGPPFANAIVETVNTLNPGEPATVAMSFDGANVRFTFGIPRGNDGPTGATGQNGEVTQVDLNNALQNTLSQTSNNSNSVGLLSESADPIYNPMQMQEVLNKMNELITTLRR